MGWTVDDDDAYFRDRGDAPSRRLSADPAGGLADYPDVAAHQIDLWRVPARLFNATSWGQWVTDSVTPEPGRLAEFDSASGRLGINRAYLRRLEAGLKNEPEGYPGRPRALAAQRWRRVLRIAAAAAFHEAIHSLGPADRRQFILEREQTQAAPGGRNFEEGLTQLATLLFLDDYMDGMGLARAPTGTPQAPIASYEGQTAYVLAIAEALAPDAETDVRGVVATLVGDGSSVAALRRLIQRSLARSHGIVDPGYSRRVADYLITPLAKIEAGTPEDVVRKLATRAVAGANLAVMLDEAPLVHHGGPHGLT